MPELSELPPRPMPRRGPAERAGAWLRWFGAGRLVIAAISVAVIAAGGVWLLQAPAPATEAGLPLATAGSVTAAPSSAVAVPATAAVTTAPPPTQLVIHVAGAVVAPGVYELPVAARVADAVDVAGGPAADGDLDGLNLAAALSDGQRVYVPVLGEVDPAAVPSGGDIDAAGVRADSTPAPGPLDLNIATAEQLEQLPGVGPATAAAIVDDRQRNGPFASVDDLDRVTGIGAAKLAALRPLVTV